MEQLPLGDGDRTADTHTEGFRRGFEVRGGSVSKSAPWHSASSSFERMIWRYGEPKWDSRPFYRGRSPLTQGQGQAGRIRRIPQQAVGPITARALYMGERHKRAQAGGEPGGLRGV